VVELVALRQAAPASVRAQRKQRDPRRSFLSPDAALGDGGFAARKLPPLFVNDIVPLKSNLWLTENGFWLKVEGCNYWGGEIYV
jgi:hypothetical protein